MIEFIGYYIISFLKSKAVKYHDRQHKAYYKDIIYKVLNIVLGELSRYRYRLSEEIW